MRFACKLCTLSPRLTYSINVAQPVSAFSPPLLTFYRDPPQDRISAKKGDDRRAIHRENREKPAGCVGSARAPRNFSLIPSIFSVTSLREIKLLRTG